MKRTKPTLAVFTPAYNRKHTIERTYKSLCNQTSHDFYWVFVDDGSTDGTRNLCESWLDIDYCSPNENERIGYARDARWLKIHYIYKENGGMHTAHNVAYEHIDTELAVCIDSDDWMPDNAVELIISKWRKEGEERFAGMIGLDAFEDGYVVGTCFPKGLKECKTYDLERKYGVICDKKYVYRPEIIKKYLPYPVFPGERYGTVNFLYQKIDQDYDMLCSNEIYCIVDYQEDGLSINVFKQHKCSPLTRAYERNVLIECLPYFKGQFKYAIQYGSCAMLAGKLGLLVKSARPFQTICAFPLSVIYYLILRTKKIRNIDMSKVKFVKASEI